MADERVQAFRTGFVSGLVLGLLGGLLLGFMVAAAFHKEHVAVLKEHIQWLKQNPGRQ
jgi:hypothetical protein